MRHSEHDLLHGELAAALDDLLQRRDHRFPAIEAEALGASIFHVEEVLEAFRCNKLVEDGDLAFGREGDLLIGAFDALLDPGFLVGIRNMHEFDTERVAVGALQDVDHLPDCRLLQA